MRQLVELHDQLETFASLDARLVVVCQKESDPANLPRITDLVGEGIDVLADPDQSTVDELPLFGAYLVDPKGTLRRELPGIKGARARTDVILSELAGLQGHKPPSVGYSKGVTWRGDDEPDVDLPSAQVLSVHWAFSHDRVRPGDELRLFVLPRLAPGWSIHAGGEGLPLGTSPFSIEVSTPPGLTLVAQPVLPRARAVELEDGTTLLVYEGDVPIPAMDFVAAPEGLPQGPQALLVTIHYQAFLGDVTRRPAERSFRLPIRFAPPGESRGQLYGWQGW